VKLWREILVDAGLFYLEWVLPRHQKFQVTIDPVAGKSWVEEVLEEDRARNKKAGPNEGTS